MAQLPTGTVTLLFTDIEGSTQLLHWLGPAYAQALSLHQAVLRAAFAAYAGAEVDTQGDAFFVAFPSAPQAVASAAAATRVLAEQSWPQGASLRVRMGLHTGSPQLVGDHYVGLDVHHAARIAAAGHGGQVLLSQTTRDLVTHALPSGVTVAELGLYRLKDLQQPERLYQLVLPGLLADFPPLKTLDLSPHNLPVQPTPLLGREAELAAISALVRQDAMRLLTLTGPGGIGKTRLAIQVAAELVEAFDDGVWYVRLSRLVDPALVLPTIAQSLDLKEQASQPIADTLRAHLAEKRLLLVLDNFEQVAAAAPEVAGLLEASPRLHVLVTSRVPLHLRGEQEFQVVPLALPDPTQPPTLEALSQAASTALFIAQAQAVTPRFSVTAANAPAIAGICVRLDGLPLTLELAASRVKVLPPEALLTRLERTLPLLTGGARDLEERQQTMRATIAWSEDLLAPQEQVLFRRLAVFVGGCTLEAIEAVCTAPEGAAPLELDVLNGLSTLVDQSLAQPREEDGEARFGMLQVIREYALERLEASGEAEVLHRAHAGYYLALVERAEPALRGPESGAWLLRLERELDNLRAALGWARVQGEAETGLRLAVALGGFWDARGHLREGQAWVEGLLALGTDDASRAEQTVRGVSAGVRARALSAAGRLALWQGDDALAARRLEAAATLGRETGDVRTVQIALNNLGIIAEQQGDLEQAEARYVESLALARGAGNQRGIAASLSNLGVLAVSRGDLERAEDYFQEALALHRQRGDPKGIALALLNLGGVAGQRGEVAQAETLGREGLALVRDVGDLRFCAGALDLLAGTAGMAGQGRRAARLLGAATALRETIGAPQPAREHDDTEQAVAPARAALGEEGWMAAYVAGHAVTPEQAITEALGEARARAEAQKRGSSPPCYL
ncbi:MAG: ATP-binding protein [Ktedonobacterales bacterium]